jgi:very-short-patch-repair endonuclease
MESNHPHKLQYTIKTAGRFAYPLSRRNAVENRSKLTDAEMCLWNEIRASKLGVHFRRQHPIGDYIVDYVCLKCWLIVEVDGEYHDTKEQQEWDRLRTEYLNSVGFKVIRFSNEEVLQHTENVVTTIIKNLIWKTHGE